MQEVHFPAASPLLSGSQVQEVHLSALLASPLLSWSQVQEVHFSALLASPLLSGSQVQEVQIRAQVSCLICHVPLCKCMYVHMCPESKAILNP